jgi:Flp pilus assembly protein TadD
MSRCCARVGHDCDSTLYPLALVLLAVLAVGCGRKGVSDYLAAGDEALQSTRLSDAETDYQQAAKLSPRDPRPHLALGNLYIFERKPPQAQAELMKALELEPRNPKTHAMLAKTYTEQSEPGLAEAQGRAAVALAPGDAEYRMSLGATLQSEEKLAAAEAEYRTAIGLEPSNAQSHLALATLLNSEPNRQNDARAEYAQVKALAPNLVPPMAASLATPAPSAMLATSTTPVEQPAIRNINKRFVLTHDSPVYESMTPGAKVVAKVHRRRYVHVTGLAGQWLRIQLRNGTIGFIPVTAAE